MTPEPTPAEIEVGAKALDRLVIKHPRAGHEAASRWVLRATTGMIERRAQVPLLELIRDLAADDELCRYDRDGLCQTHALHRRPCPHERARRVLARANLPGGDHA